MTYSKERTKPTNIKGSPTTNTIDNQDSNTNENPQETTNKTSTQTTTNKTQHDNHETTNRTRSTNNDRQGPKQQQQQQQQEENVEDKIPDLIKRWQAASDDDESDSEEENDDDNRIPDLQERDREDSDSDSDSDDEEEEDETAEDSKIATTTEPTVTHQRESEGYDDEDLYYEPSDDEQNQEEDHQDITTNESEVHEHATVNQERTKEIMTTQQETILHKTDNTTTEIKKKKKKKMNIDNIPFGHICDNIAIGNDTPYIRLYCQNVNGIFDREGIGLDTAFEEIKQVGADIFTFNETHGDESNATARKALRLSKQRMWRDNNEDCKIIHSSSTAPVLTFTKPGGNMVGITGPLVGRIRDTIKDPFGRWCGYTIIGRDNKEILILTAYNVSQFINAKVGEDTLFNQQIALYKLMNIREPNPKKIFIEDLVKVISKARASDKDIILTGDFNELVGDDPNMMAKVLLAGGLTDVHGHQHGNVDITTYTQGHKRLDYVFVSPRLIDHVLRSGYEAFHTRIASDHRGYFVDFAMEGLLDRQLPSIFSASSRSIRGTHPSNITKYIENLHKYLKENEIYRLANVQKNWYEKEKLEALDNKITKGMLAAEGQCRIHHRQSWNKEVNEVMTTANILRIQLSSLRTGIDCTKQIEQKQRLLQTRIILPTEIDDTSVALRLAQKNCRILIHEQRNKQTSMEEEQEAAFVAMKPEMGAKRAAQLFQRAKDTKRMMSELPSKMNCPGGISALLVPLPKEGIELEYLPVTEGSTIESLILNRNIRHFRQAESTPLATKDIIDKIGWGADTQTAEDLLEGKADPTDITDDEWSRFLLASMKRNSEELNIEITPVKMMGKYMRWKERTSTSPSGRHLGHFHALFRPLKAANKEDRERLDGIRQEIIELHATMLQTAYDNEHVYKRWEYIITCMLAKEPGIPRIHRLRVIHLYECDLNLLFSLFFRELDQHCEDNYLINKGVYGCRPNRRAIDPVFVDVTQTEQSMVTRTVLVRFNNDATACFDRILVHLLSLCIRSFGMPKKLTKILGELLKMARYAIKTGIGISEETYQHSDTSPAFGSGQGSAASAQGWTKIVSKLFDLHDKYGHGCKYADPWKMYTAIITMLGFVDDNNITNNGDNWEKVEDVIKRTQHDAQLWNDLLRASGGALNLDKCFVQVLDYHFARNGGPVIAPADPKIRIIIHDKTNKKDVQLKPISPYRTYRFLGTEQGISLNQKQQHKNLHKTSGAHQRRLVCSAMSPRCAWVHYTAVFQRSVGYPLAMCHLSETQLHDLQKKYIPALLNKIGIIRTHAHALVFGPSSYGGIGCNDLRIEQGLDSIENLIRQFRTPGYGKEMATIFLRTLQHTSGMSQPLLQYPDIRAPHLEGHYYSHIRKFLSKHKAQLEIECIPPPTYERHGDAYIMDVICTPESTKTLHTKKLRTYSDAEIRKLYYCKCYLQVKRISDLCTADGLFILPSIVKGEMSIRQCASRLSEARQERPNEATWKIWKAFLNTLCADKDESKDIRKTKEMIKQDKGERLRLKQPLGDWKVLVQDSERLWPFYYSNDKNIRYRSYRKEWHKQGSFTFDCHQGTNDETFDYGKFDSTTTLPLDSVPVDVFDADTGWRISYYQQLDIPTKPTANIKSFLDHLYNQEEHIAQYYTEVEFHTTPVAVYEQLKSTRTALIATDGGAIPRKGSLGFAIADEEGIILLTCYGQPSGHDPLSFRSEICAFLAAVRLTRLLIEYYDDILCCTDKERTKVQFYTDSLSMMKKLKSYDKYPTAPLKTVLNSEWDVLSALHRSLKWFNTYPKINWVKSHQDDKVYDATAMPLDAYLNSVADELATIGLKRLQEKPIVPMDPETALQFHIRGRTITRDFKKTVRETIQLIPLRTFYCKRFSWSDNVFDLIDWDIFRPVYKKYSANKGIQWIHKFCIKKLATAERVNKRDHFHDKRCASCWEKPEDDDHLVQCTNRRSLRKQVISKINSMHKGMDPKLIDILKEGITAYFKGDSVSNTMLRVRGQEGYKRYDLLIDEQTVIGWDNLLRGKFSKQWKIYQKAFANRIKLSNPRPYENNKRRKKRNKAKNDTAKKRNKTEEFHALFQAIVPIMHEMWTDRCVDRNTPVIGGRIVAEYEALKQQVTQLYSMKEMVLPEDETKIFNEEIKVRLGDTNRQLKKWIGRWKPVIDHSMKRVKELAKENSKPIWKHFTANRPAKTTVSRKQTQQIKPKKYSNNPLTNVYTRLKKKRSSSRVLPVVKAKYKINHLISRLYNTLGKKRSTSRETTVIDTEEQIIDDRFGDEPT